MLRRICVIVRSRRWPSSKLSALDRSSVLIPSRAFGSDSFFAVTPSEYYKTNRTTTEITQAILSKYYGQPDGKAELIAKSLSPHVISSMVETVTQSSEKIDFKTADMLVDQAVMVGKPALAAVESLISFYIKSNNVVAAANVLCKCDPTVMAVSEGLCQKLVNKLVENYNWKHSFITALYMISLDYKFSSDVILFTVGGLMKTPEGVGKALELIRMIAIKQRSDLAEMFSFTQVGALSASLNGSNHDPRQIPTPLLQEAMSAVLAQQRHNGWFSFNIAKMLVGLACAGDHDQLAADFARESLRLASAGGQLTSTGAPLKRSACEVSIDQVQLLRCYAQGDGVAPKMAHHMPKARRKTQYSALTLALLDQCWEGDLATQVLQEQGPMRAHDFLGMYWVLAHRARDASLPEIAMPLDQARIEQSGAPARIKEARDLGNSIVSDLYHQLAAFWDSSFTQSHTFSPRPGYERRSLRILCDAFGLRHKLVVCPENAWAHDVQVWKPQRGVDVVEVDPPHLEDLLHVDAKLNPKGRQFDGVPLYWHRAVQELQKMEDEKLTVVVQRLLSSMRHYASVSWALLLLEQLWQRDLPLPEGALRNVLKMCDERDDLYGLLEVLHAAYLEQEVSRSPEYQQRLFQLRERAKYACDVRVSNYSNADESEERMTDFNTESENRGVDFLNARDWTKACTLVTRTSVRNVPVASYQTAFTEMMTVMQRCNRNSVDPAVLGSLLTFLVHTGADASQLSKLTKRLYTDKNAAIRPSECIALSAHLHRRLSEDRRILQLSRNTSASNYIYVFPDTLYQMATLVRTSAISGDLGAEFLKKFEYCWGRLHSPDGRSGLYELLRNLLSEPSDTRDALVNSQDPDDRDAVTLLCIYTGYLLSAYEQQHRAAFDLLFLAEELHRDALTAQSRNADKRRQRERSSY